MAEIFLCSLHRHGDHGPDYPGEMNARLVDREWPGGGTVKRLHLSIGKDSVEIWPADPEQLKQLGEKLIQLSEVAK